MLCSKSFGQAIKFMLINFDLELADEVSNFLSVCLGALSYFRG